MSSRFPSLPDGRMKGCRFANLRERLNASLPGEASYMSNHSNLRRLAAFRTTQASAPTTQPAKKTAKALSLAKPAEYARREAPARVADVMKSSAYSDREKQAAELLLASCDRGNRFMSSAAIVAELKTRRNGCIASESQTGRNRNRMVKCCQAS